MPTSEFAKRGNQLLDRCLGEAGVFLTDMIFRRVVYMGQENIKRTNERLAEGNSVMLVSDHPGTMETIYTAGLIPRYFNSRKESGMLVKDAFVTDGMGFVGRVAIDILDRRMVEPLGVKTPKYEPDKKTRTGYNFRSVKRCLEILDKPGGLLLIFASGTRSSIMFEAEKGLGRFSAKADWVVPITTITGSKGRPRIVVHEPLSGIMGVEWCTQQFGDKKVGRQVFSDLVMSIVAIGQPDKEKRGVYKEQANQLEIYKKNPTERISQFADPRLRRTVEAYIAWKSGRFEE